MPPDGIEPTSFAFIGSTKSGRRAGVEERVFTGTINLLASLASQLKKSKTLASDVLLVPEIEANFQVCLLGYLQKRRIKTLFGEN